MEVFIHCVLLASWLLCRFGTAYLLFGARVRTGFIIGVGGSLHLLLNSLEVTLIESLKIKFVKLVGLHLDPLEVLFTGFFSCFLKLLVIVSRSVTLLINFFFI